MGGDNVGRKMQLGWVVWQRRMGTTITRMLPSSAKTWQNTSGSHTGRRSLHAPIGTKKIIRVIEKVVMVMPNHLLSPPSYSTYGEHDGTIIE